MENWRWWHLVLLWLGAIVLAVFSEWRQGGGFRARPTTAGTGLVGVRTSFSLRTLLAVVFLILLVVTVMWFRSRGGGAG